MHTVLHRSFTIVSDFFKFYFEVETFKTTLHKNAYHTKFVDKCIAKFVNKFLQKPIFITVPKLELTIALPYLGNISSITKRDWKDVLINVWNFVNIISFFKLVTDSRIILDLKIVFLKPSNLNLSINLSAEAAQLSITVKFTDIWRFGFQNTRVYRLEQVN